MREVAGERASSFDVRLRGAAGVSGLAAALAGLVSRQLRRFSAGWAALSLVSQFTVAAAAVMLAGMVLLGTWVSSRIEQVVVQNAALSAAFYMDNFLEPQLQDLAAGDTLKPSSIEALDRIRGDAQLARQIAVIKVWTRRGTVVYSTDAGVVGKSFPETAGFKQALSGKIFSEYESLDEEENADERKLNRPLMEIYSPIHRSGTNDIIAVAEFYIYSDSLGSDIAAARRGTALAVAGVTLLMLASLFGIVRRGSTMIAEQRVALEQRVQDLSRALSQNERLRGDLIDARKRVVETNDRVLRRIGADIHDGPAQLVGLALLRFHQLDPSDDRQSLDDKKEGYELLQKVLEDTLAELRTISYGIAPPHLENLPLARAIERAVENHMKRTGSNVERAITVLPEPASDAVKTCLYRFTQEGLSNAFRHGGGVAQRVAATVTGRVISVEVADGGKGFDLSAPSEGLGLAGLRDRIESLGGRFEIISAAGRGTRLVATFDLGSP